MCYQFNCCDHPDAEIFRLPAKCPRHNLEYDASGPCPECEGTPRRAMHIGQGFVPSLHIDRDDVDLKV